MTTPQSDFAKRITVAWQKTVKSILEVGHLLLAAKKKLPHGDFTAMVQNDLPFGIRTAECLMAIARHSRLAKANPHTCASLPSSWRALYELSRLSVRQFDAALREGRIFADLTVTEASWLADNAETKRQARYEPATLELRVTHDTIPVRSVAYYSGDESRPLLDNDEIETVLREQQEKRVAYVKAQEQFDEQFDDAIRRLPKDHWATDVSPALVYQTRDPLLAHLAAIEEGLPARLEGDRLERALAGLEQIRKALAEPPTGEVVPFPAG
jgi:hypothetical protein